MDDTGTWWDGVEVGEGLGSPLEELESLVVSLELDLFVLVSGIEGLVDVSLNGVVNNEIDWAEWVDLLWVSSELDHSVSHGGEVDDTGDSSEILEDNSGGLEGDLDLLGGLLLPIKDVLDVLGLNLELVAVSDGRFQQNSDGVG